MRDEFLDTETPKAILFDIGGVLVELDGMPSLARDMGVEFDKAEIHKKWSSAKWVTKHETGQVEALDFAKGVVAELGIQISATDFLERFLKWPTKLLPQCNEVIQEAVSQARVAALSNMSKVHWQVVCGLGLDVDLFEQTFVSYRTGQLKPNMDAYKFAADKLSLSPDEIVFVDDSAANVIAAKVYGMRGILANNPIDAREKLTRVGVLS